MDKIIKHIDSTLWDLRFPETGYNCHYVRLPCIIVLLYSINQFCPLFLRWCQCFVHLRYPAICFDIFQFLVAPSTSPSVRSEVPSPVCLLLLPLQTILSFSSRPESILICCAPSEGFAIISHCGQCLGSSFVVAGSESDNPFSICHSFMIAQASVWFDFFGFYLYFALTLLNCASDCICKSFQRQIGVSQPLFLYLRHSALPIWRSSLSVQFQRKSHLRCISMTIAVSY